MTSSDVPPRTPRVSRVPRVPRATIREVTPPRPASQGVGERREPPPTRTRAARPVLVPDTPPARAWREARTSSVVAQERASFGYAFDGLRYSWTTQRHLRIHVSLALLAIGLGLFLTITLVEWAVLLAIIALVIALELLNTVVEVVVDMIAPEHHPQAKVAKDVAAGAVLAAAAGALLVGCVIFIPRIVGLLLPAVPAPGG
jgi:diacylglycerol kinase